MARTEIVVTLIKRDGLPDLLGLGEGIFECRACGQEIRAECTCCEPPRHRCVSSSASALGRVGGRASGAARKGDSEAMRALARKRWDRRTR